MERLVRRRRRVMLRDRLRPWTTLERVRACGAVPVTGDGAGPVLRISETPDGRVAGYAGLSTCSSVWACTVCAPKIAARRAEDLTMVMRAVLDAGGSASLMTFTMRHTRRDRLRDCWDAVTAAWSRVTSGRTWVADQELGGMLGWARAAEVTYGEHGWHVHLHVLVCWDRPVSREFAAAIGGRMWARWSRALARRGYSSVVLLDDRDEMRGGLDVRMASLGRDSLADYFTKLAHEVTGGAAKLARGHGRTPFQILESAVEGVADDVETWWEWERGSHERRQLTWSGGTRDLRRLAQLQREQTDEEIAGEEIGGPDVLRIPAETWRVLRGGGWAVQLLEVAEQAGPAAARAWLDRRGLPSLLLRGPG